MFRPVKMCKVNILVLNKHVAEVTRALGRCGLIHLVDAVRQSSAKVLSAENNTDLQRMESLLARLDRLIESLGLESLEKSSSADSSSSKLSLEEMESLLDKVEQQIKESEGKVSELIEQSGALDKQRATVAGYSFQDIRMDLLHNLAHFHVFAGHIPRGTEQRCMLELGERAVMIKAEQGTSVLVLCTRKNRSTVQTILTRFGFKELQTSDMQGSIEEEIERLDQQIAALQTDLEKARLQVLQLAEEYGGVLLALRSHLHTAHAIEEARRLFGKVSRLYCISGWTPEEKVARVRAIVEQSSYGTGLVEIVPAEEDESVKSGRDAVPVEMRGGWLARPFQMLIKSYGLPGYNELDPTLFVGVTFLLLFGFMFGDIGQGAVLALFGWWLRKSSNETFRDGGLIIMLCGLVAVLFGFAYGSVFGFELKGELLGWRHEWLHPIWLSPLEQGSIRGFLLTAVGVGTVFMSVAVIINIINHFLAKRFFEGVFDRFGVLGLLFYWVALAVGMVAMYTQRIPTWGIVLILLPVCALAMKYPTKAFLARLKRRKDAGKQVKKDADKEETEQEEESSVFVGSLETALELMETLTGYLSGTVSFVRIGAYAISHAALCMAIYAIANNIRGFQFTGSTFIAIIIVVLGNVLVIGFEGMVAMIQSVRLEYYELFGKYFSGNGIPYQPFHIQQPKQPEGET